jgi:predicted ATPase
MALHPRKKVKMLTSLQIKNFKAWKDTGEIRLAPLTVIFGANSAGKSSLGHLLLALKQTALSADRKRHLHLGDEKTLIDLGTFAECLYNHDTKSTLSFELGWEIAGKNLEIRDPLDKKSRFAGNELKLTVALASDAKEQPKVDLLKYQLLQDSVAQLSIDYRRDEKGNHNIASGEYKFVKNTGRSWPLDEPDKFYRISDLSRARFQNAEFLSDLALKTEAILSSVFYLGPLREHPKRIYPWSGETPESVGQNGGAAIASILAASNQNRMLNRGPNTKLARFDMFIARWLKDLGIIQSFEVKQLAQGRKEYEVVVKTHSTASPVKITDVGFGVSQVLPALVQAFYCPPNSTIWMEQPEIHLHPQVQAELADVFISATKAREGGKERHVQLIVESHSEHFLNRLQRRIAEGVLEPKDVAIYFCRRSGAETELEPLRMNMFGEIENWPENFFGDEMADISGRAIAAMQRKSEATLKVEK